MINCTSVVWVITCDASLSIIELVQITDVETLGRWTPFVLWDINLVDLSRFLCSRSRYVSVLSTSWRFDLKIWRVWDSMRWIQHWPITSRGLTYLSSMGALNSCSACSKVIHWGISLLGSINADLDVQYVRTKWYPLCPPHGEPSGCIYQQVPTLCPSQHNNWPRLRIPPVGYLSYLSSCMHIAITPHAPVLL